MRIPRYLSPTSLMKWEQNKEEFYLQYLADNRPPKIPQTQPMSVGSAFDAYIKSYFHERLFGKGHPDSAQFEFEAIFALQVESEYRDWAREAGKNCFDAYIASGAMADLFMALETAHTEPKFEFTIEGFLDGVTLLGKPDLHFVNKNKRLVILDWKVNGYCGKSMTSPAKGYVNVRDGWKEGWAGSRNVNAQHKDAVIFNIDGIRVNTAHKLEEVKEDWAIQLSTYAWLVGAKVGEDFICAIDQLCGVPCPDKVRIRVAEHRCQIGKAFQEGTLARFKSLWETIHSGYIFRDMTREESFRRQAMLDLTYQAYEAEGEDDMADLYSRE